jgi:hypothetical protein
MVLYTKEEIEWQKKNIPLLLKQGIIQSCQSPFAAKTTFPRKSNGTLRMVHTYCPLNDGTIKSRAEEGSNRQDMRQWPGEHTMHPTKLDSVGEQGDEIE